MHVLDNPRLVPGHAIAELNHSSRQHGAHIKLLPDRSRANLPALVVRNRGPGHHFQVGQLRESVYNAFSNSVAEVLHAWIRARIHERQNGDRIQRSFLIARFDKNRPRVGRSFSYCLLAGFPFFDFIFKFKPMLEALKIAVQIFCALIALVRLFAQRFGDNADQFGRSFRCEVRKQRRFGLQYRGENVAGRFAIEGSLARKHLVDHHAERKNV